MDGFTVRGSDSQESTTRLGTRFLVFPQPPFVPGYERPEVIWISTPPSHIGAGPSDRRMYVIDPRAAKDPYDFPFLPPYAGLLHPPARSGPDGHFDHLPIGTREFNAAHVFACVRRMLDLCESYSGAEIPWFFEPTYDRLEIVPQLRWRNAHSGFGFLEMGEDDGQDEPFPLALNFDAIAHETGHLVLLGVLGTPQSLGPETEFFAYHEAAADYLALLGLLHFDTVLDRVLRRTKGNLLIVNELDRFAELSDEKQIRMFNHALKVWDVSTEVHDLSKPFAGALFDALIEIYHVLLVQRGLSDLDPRAFEDLRSVLAQDDVEHEVAVLSRDYEIKHYLVKSALIEARDLMGEVLAQSWRRFAPDNFVFRDAAEAMVTAAEAGRARPFADRLVASFAWRGLL